MTKRKKKIIFHSVMTLITGGFWLLYLLSKLTMRNVGKKVYKNEDYMYE